MKCRHIRCEQPLAGFVRVQYTYSDNRDAGQTEYDIDDDWCYCEEHLSRHEENHGSSASYTFIHSMEDYRP